MVKYLMKYLWINLLIISVYINSLTLASHQICVNPGPYIFSTAISVERVLYLKRKLQQTHIILSIIKCEQMKVWTSTSTLSKGDKRTEDHSSPVVSGTPTRGLTDYQSTQLPGFASFIVQQQLLMIFGISVCSFLPVSCLILCSKTAELIINT